MKIVISHRGNINGRIESLENHPEYVLEALQSSFDVEVDVWCVEGKLLLGHDKPQYEIDHFFLTDPSLWIHCKNVEAMELLSQDSSLNIFAHKDDIVITTHGYLWTAPGKIITPRSIAVMPEMVEYWDISKALGVCTDYPIKY